MTDAYVDPAVGPPRTARDGARPHDAPAVARPEPVRRKDPGAGRSDGPATGRSERWETGRPVRPVGGPPTPGRDVSPPPVPARATGHASGAGADHVRGSGSAQDTEPGAGAGVRRGHVPASRPRPGSASAPAPRATSFVPATAGACAEGCRIAAALRLARSGRLPGPDIAAGSAVTAWSGEPLPVPGDLDRLLRASFAGGRLRPTASAGALHPVNVHLLVGPGGVPEPGRYAYDPVAHRLHRRGGAPAAAPAGVVVVLTVTARRTVSHYGHRAWPLLLLDTGHALAALALAGAHAHCGDTDGTLLAAAAGLATGGGEPEHAVAAAWWNRGPAERPAPDVLARWAAHGPGDAPLGARGPAPRVLLAAWDALTEVTASAGEGSWHGFPGLPSSPPGTRRRSAPPGFGGVPEPAELARLLRAAEAAGPEGVRWCVAVGGPEPAVLGGPGLRTLATGDARPTLARWAAGQAWLAEAGAVLLAYGCPDDAPPAEIRRTHLGAGYAVGIAQVLACAAGSASRPVGSWQSADLGAALGEPPGRSSVLHALALGRRSEGSPSAPPSGPSASARPPSSPAAQGAPPS